MLRPGLYLALLTLTSCADLHIGRSYLSEMEHDDSTFFSPREDFPIVAGDSGRYWLSDQERKQRTPASSDEQFEDLKTLHLKKELRDLEGLQSEENLALYEQYRKNLSTISEKIFFLKLPPYERKDYLEARGFISAPKGPTYSVQERMFAVRNQDVVLGMRKDEVLSSIGKPLRVEVAGNPRNENERWLYRMNGASKYIYFESGEVQGWE